MSEIFIKQIIELKIVTFLAAQSLTVKRPDVHRPLPFFRFIQVLKDDTSIFFVLIRPVPYFQVISATFIVRQSQGGLKVTDDNDAEKISQNHHLVR